MAADGARAAVELPGLEAGDYDLELEAEDDEGRRAAETTLVRVEPARLDAGVLDAGLDAGRSDAASEPLDGGRSDAGPAAPSRAFSSAGCASTAAGGLAPLVALGLAGALLARRRRRCC